MTTATFLTPQRRAHASPPSIRPSKRIKIAISDSDDRLEQPLELAPSESQAPHGAEEEDQTTISSHPLGVKPLGNYNEGTGNLRDALRGPIGAFSDDLLCAILETLDAPTLRSLGETCKALWGFCHQDELWRQLYMRSPGNVVDWRGSWRRTLLGLDPDCEPVVNCVGLFSDVLYRPFQCSRLLLRSFHSRIPRSRSIPRYSHLSRSDFKDGLFEQPFILTDVVSEWPVYQSGRLTIEALLLNNRATSFRAEQVQWPLGTYVEYANTTTDESPLYLFDQSFRSKLSLSPLDYPLPECFGEDLFDHLGSRRPHDQWLIIGPTRSGSTFHKDPNSTSAWNAVLQGKKYWLMFPPEVQPPGIHVSANEGEVTSPLSIAEWLLEFHAAARLRERGLEGVCREGEFMHVPAGWWHLVVNLEESVALTGNFVSETGLDKTLLFLRDKRDQVSGFDEDAEAIDGCVGLGNIGEGHGLYEHFIERLSAERPRALAGSLARIVKSQTRNGRGGRWAEATDQLVGNGEFSFSFAED